MLRTALFLLAMLPFAVQAGDVASGQALYKAHCALCHGAQGQGVPPMFPGLVSKPVEAYAAMMRNYRDGHGHEVMVEMARSLSEQQLDDLMAYLASLPKK